MRNIFLFIISFMMITFSQAQTDMVVRLDNPTNSQLEIIKNQKIEITAFEKDRYIDLFVSNAEYQLLKEEGFKIEITQTHEQNIQNLSAQKDIAGYRTYDEVLAELQQIAIDYPEICSLTDIGDSHGKEYYNSGMTGYADYQHDIWMLKISDNVNETEDEPAVFYMGAHHAREPISTEVVMGIINHLLEGYGTDDEITNMVNETEIYIVPIVNPDGHEVVLDQLNTMWRKNVADGDGNGFLNYNSGSQDGVDPNRNYGWEWGGDGSSGSLYDETYRGPEAFSEPETQAMRDLLASHHFTTGITYHSYSELVLWPYAYSANSEAPDHEAMQELGTQMAMSIPKITGSGHYTPEQSNELYPAAGITDDWAYGKHGIFSYTIELAQEFIPPSYQVPEIVNDNIESAMMLLNRPNVQTLRGHVYDAITLEPIVADVFIEGIDGTASFKEPYKSNANFGAYYRLLMEGEETVTFSSYGYISQTFENIEILSNEATILDVYLEHAPNGPVFGSVIDGNTGEAIEGAAVQILNTPLLPAYTNEVGVYEMDEVAYNSYQLKISKEGYSSIIVDQVVSNTQYILNFVLLPSEAISFEEGEFLEEFNFSGSMPWLIDENISFSGDHSAVSGNIGDNQNSTMTLTIEDGQAGELSFYRKVSSESGWDWLKFYIDGVELQSWSGDEDWEKVTFPVQAGTHEYKWSYTKDSNTSNGSDQSWVDDIELPAEAIIMVNAGPDLQVCSFDQALLNAFAANYETFKWTTSGDGTFSDENNPNSYYTPGNEDIGTGQVALTATAQGISDETSDELTLYVETCLGIEELQANDFKISPNPAQDLFNISFESKDLKELRIYDITGKLIQNIQLASDQRDIQLNANSFHSGIYIVKVINIKGWSVAKRLILE